MRKQKTLTEEELTAWDVHSAAVLGHVDFLRKHLRTHGTAYVNSLAGDTNSFQLMDRDYESDLHLRETPLHAALRFGQVKVARLLLQHGADVNARDSYGCTPLMHVGGIYYLMSVKGKNDLIRLLLDKGTDINAKDIFGRSVIHEHLRGLGEYTPKQQEVDKTIPLLARRGADMNARDETGSTPLVYIIAGAKKETLEFLVQNGADIHAPVPISLKWGKGVRKNVPAGSRRPVVPDVMGSLLHLAALHNNREAMEFLSSRGLSFDTRDEQGLTPLERISRDMRNVRRRLAKGKTKNTELYKDQLERLQQARRTTLETMESRR